MNIMTTPQYSSVEHQVFETMKSITDTELKNEILDFVQFLVQKQSKQNANADATISEKAK